MKYVLSVGTNIGNRKENIEKTAEALELLPKTKILRKSSIYETQPVGYDEQQNFFNACFELESDFEPHEMLGACLGIEAGFGRVRKIKNGPRIIDIDIIFAENMSISAPNLTVPHPRFRERRFVLVPLEELYPGSKAFGFDFSNIQNNIENQELKKI